MTKHLISYESMILGLSITTVALSGISLTIMHPAPILTLLPILIPPNMVAPAPMKTLFPILGHPGFWPSPE